MSVLCPFCFTHFPIQECHFRCVNAACVRPGTTDATEPDEALRQYEAEMSPSGTAPPRPQKHAFAAPKPSGGGSPPALNKLFQKMGAGKDEARQAKCDWCKKESPKRLCPHCHNELPHVLGEMSNHIIAVIGAKEVGKSYYIGQLIRAIRSIVGQRFSFALIPVNDATINRFRTGFDNPLSQGRKIDASRVTDPQPLIYRLEIRPQGNLANDLMAQALGKNALSLVFFDTAGENFDSMDSLTTRTRYLLNASGIILLLDPLQIGKVRDELEGKGCPLPYEHTEPAEILSRVVNAFEQYGNVKVGRKIKVPVAVAFTKSDALLEYGLLDPSGAVYGLPPHEGAFDAYYGGRIHEEAHGALLSWDSTVENLLSAKFENYSYHCVSALGAVQSGGTGAVTANPQPHRVEDPFLWLLSRLGFVKSTRNK